jgi:cobalt transporter subunit CbtB
MQTKAMIAATARPVAISGGFQLLTVFLLGAVFLYVAGFVQTSAVHNAAHDMRHSLGFPCH